MDYYLKTFDKTQVEICQFDNGTEVKEYHAMIHVSDSQLPFANQLEAVLAAYIGLLNEFPDTQAVFKRYYLSDAANQQDEVIDADMTDCAKSIIQQAPLDGTKVALWVYLMTNVHSSITHGGLYVAEHNGFRHLWNGSATALQRV